MTDIHIYTVLKEPGLSVLTPAVCKDCIHRTERNFCEIWAFPQVKWNQRQSCPDFSKDKYH